MAFKDHGLVGVSVSSGIILIGWDRTSKSPGKFKRKAIGGDSEAMETYRRFSLSTTGFYSIWRASQKALMILTPLMLLFQGETKPRLQLHTSPVTCTRQNAVVLICLCLHILNSIEAFFKGGWAECEASARARGPWQEQGL